MPFLRSAPKKSDFLVEIFQKVPKNACCWPFFKSLNAAQKICSKWGLYRDLRDLRRKQFGRPKNHGRQNCQIFFENPPVPSINPKI